MFAPIDLARILSRFAITNGWIFYSFAAIVVGYLLYIMIRRRRGERPESSAREPEL
jgi:hypothetical protein